jgi:hypothetical protein
MREEKSCKGPQVPASSTPSELAPAELEQTTGGQAAPTFEAEDEAFSVTWLSRDTDVGRC